MDHLPICSRTPILDWGSLARDMEIIGPVGGSEVSGESCCAAAPWTIWTPGFRSPMRCVQQSTQNPVCAVEEWSHVALVPSRVYTLIHDPRINPPLHPGRICLNFVTTYLSIPMARGWSDSRCLSTFGQQEIRTLQLAWLSGWHPDGPSARVAFAAAVDDLNNGS